MGLMAGDINLTLHCNNCNLVALSYSAYDPQTGLAVPPSVIFDLSKPLTISELAAGNYFLNWEITFNSGVASFWITLADGSGNSINIPPFPDISSSAKTIKDGLEFSIS